MGVDRPVVGWARFWHSLGRKGVSRMLMSLQEINNCRIHATDGELGGVEDFLFDDDAWAVRYLCADTRKWLPGRKVLVAPVSVQNLDVAGKRVDVALTVEQVENSPPVAADAPVSRQMADAISRYYAWPVSWSPETAVEAPKPGQAVTPGAAAGTPGPPVATDEQTLRSFHAVSHYRTEATDGSIGQAKDFLVDIPGWSIRYLVVDTGKWLPGRKVLIAPAWISTVRWADSSIHVLQTRDAIGRSPAYDAATVPQRDYETALYSHYDMPGYWE